jgi:hypothetical protein
MRVSRSIAALLPVAALAACGGEDSLGEPRQIQPATSDSNFKLFVSNQSGELDPVDIRFFFDGEVAVEGDFPAGRDYTFDLELEPGTTNLNGVSEAGATQWFNFVEYREGDGVLYGVFEFHLEADDPVAYFTFELLDQPPAFR